MSQQAASSQHSRLRILLLPRPLLCFTHNTLGCGVVLQPLWQILGMSTLMIWSYLHESHELLRRLPSASVQAAQDSQTYPSGGSFPLIVENNLGGPYTGSQSAFFKGPLGMPGHSISLLSQDVQACQVGESFQTNVSQHAY